MLWERVVVAVVRGTGFELAMDEVLGGGFRRRERSGRDARRGLTWAQRCDLSWASSCLVRWSSSS